MPNQNERAATTEPSGDCGQVGSCFQVTIGYCGDLHECREVSCFPRTACFSAPDDRRRAAGTKTAGPMSLRTPGTRLRNSYAITILVHISLKSVGFFATTSGRSRKTSAPKGRLSVDVPRRSAWRPESRRSKNWSSESRRASLGIPGTTTPVATTPTTRATRAAPVAAAPIPCPPAPHHSHRAEHFTSAREGSCRKCGPSRVCRVAEVRCRGDYRSSAAILSSVLRKRPARRRSLSSKIQSRGDSSDSVTLNTSSQASSTDQRIPKSLHSALPIASADLSRSHI